MWTDERTDRRMDKQIGVIVNTTSGAVFVGKRHLGILCTDRNGNAEIGDKYLRYLANRSLPNLSVKREIEPKLSTITEISERFQTFSGNHVFSSVFACLHVCK